MLSTNAEVFKTVFTVVLVLVAFTCLISALLSARWDGEDAAKARKSAKPRIYSLRTAWLRFTAFAAALLTSVLEGVYAVYWIEGDWTALFDWSLVLAALAVAGPIVLYHRGHSLYVKGS